MEGKLHQVDKGAKKKNILNHIKPNEVVISCLHICLILFDYVCRLLIAIGGLSFMLSISGKDVF